MFGKDIKYEDNVISDVVMAAATHEFGSILNLEMEDGRYFSPIESHLGSAVVVIGYRLADELFPNQSAIGKMVRVRGQKMSVIGVLKREGKSLLGDGFDDVVIMPYNYLRRYANVNDEKMMPLMFVKAKEGVPLERLKDELTGVLRAHRRLQPREEDDFALNQLSLLTSIVDTIFAVIDFAGLLIGFFSILVGGFGIANIMFVSVKERTGIIGIKKSMGAKRGVILMEFLIESIVLCLVGGLLGIGLVAGLAAIGNQFITSFELSMTWSNVYWGLGISAAIGIISGFIPARQAARMDPVEAIRHNY